MEHKISKLQRGNTMVVTIIILIIFAIISLALTYSIAYTSKSRIKNSTNTLSKIVLENDTFSFLNSCYDEYLVDNSITEFISTMDNTKYSLVWNYNEVDKILNFSVLAVKSNIMLNGSIVFETNHYKINSWSVK